MNGGIKILHKVVMLMSTYEAISLMIGFGALVAAIINGQKK